jgi:hypothetical protein
VAPYREQGLWVGLQIMMHQDLPLSVQDADVPRPGVQGDATVKVMRLGVESPEVSSSPVGCFPSASSPTVGGGGGGLNAYQLAAGDGKQRPLVPRSRCLPRLMPSVRHEFHRSGKEVRQQQWSLTEWRVNFLCIEGG